MKKETINKMYNYLNNLANKQGCNVDIELDRLLKEYEENAE